MLVHDACAHVVLWQALLSAFGRPLGQEPFPEQQFFSAGTRKGLLRGYDGYVNPYC